MEKRKRKHKGKGTDSSGDADRRGRGMGGKAGPDTADITHEEFEEYRAYLEDLVRNRTETLQRLNEQLEAEVDLHRATVQALRRSEASFKAIAETAPDIISRFDRDLRHLYVNPAVEGVTGLTQKNFLGKTDRELGMPESLCRLWEEMIREVFKTGKIQSTYFEFPSPDGLRIFHMRLAPELSSTEEVVTVVSVARDVTDARRAEEALRRSEESFRHLANNAPCMIIRLSRDLEITFANPASAQLTGMDPAEVMGKPIGRIGLPQPALTSLTEILNRVFRTGRKEASEVGLEVGGQGRTFEISIVPESAASGNVETALMIVHDVTEAKRASEILKRDKAETQLLVDERTAQLLEAKMQLANAQRLSDVGTLAATVAHELRNPLAVIQTALYNIRKKRKNRDIDKHLVSIEKKIAESNQIISNLLSYSRLKQPQLKQTDLYGLIKKSVAGVRESFPSSKARVTERLGSIRGQSFTVDPDQMRQVFVNIMNNAFQAVGEAHGKITVVARRDEEGKDLLISFGDNGVGMSDAEIERALDPFFTTKSKGTGLGLTICHDIVGLHGGSLAIESNAGEGTKVTITLPVR
jgi:PAS domain S-box-containing protein